MAIAARGYRCGSDDELPERKRPTLARCQSYTLPRDGKRPICFAGLLLVESFGTPTTWDYRDDWGGMGGISSYDLAVYHAADGGYIVHWSYSGRRDGDIPHHEVGKFDDLEATIAALETYDPVQWLAQPATQADQARVRERYEAQVSALCAALDVVEEW